VSSFVIVALVSPACTPAPLVTAQTTAPVPTPSAPTAAPSPPARVAVDEPPKHFVVPDHLVSYEEAVAAAEGTDAVAGRGSLAQEELMAPLVPALFASCHVPQGVRVWIRIAIVHGAPVGLTVSTTPADAAGAPCVYARIAKLRWRDSTQLDVILTAYD
jgi:hypothetical protein